MKEYKTGKVMILLHAYMSVHCFFISKHIFYFFYFLLLCASLAAMQESTSVTSSLSKTYSVTGDLLGLSLSVRREMTINI